MADDSASFNAGQTIDPVASVKFDAGQPIDPVAPIKFDAGQPIDLEASLLGGQAHRWKREGDWYSGVLRGNLVFTRQQGKTIELVSSPTDPGTLVPEFRHYLRLDDDLPSIYAEITQDPNVSAQVKRYPGLRVLRQKPWECLVAYICSANSNIETIHLNMERLSNEFGYPLKLDVTQTATGRGRKRNRQAPHLPNSRRPGRGWRSRVAPPEAGIPCPVRPPGPRWQSLEGRLDLQRLTRAPYDETKSELMALKGIGDKIADCIALMSLEKLEAFPIDVWVRRALGRLVFPRPEDAHQPYTAALGPGILRTLCRLRQPVPVPRQTI